ncbi:hypothetical protein EVAR_90561_1 [Eumeta japonica]|uniref:Uncharacterized protein n=1 Tax=Eumeta variegata TaxID=151549 RepID=A0A4C1YUP8_EUMVA|nr:hypothetical protein EVAR_90561_1 [Eumeta japonica]
MERLHAESLATGKGGDQSCVLVAVNGINEAIKSSLTPARPPAPGDRALLPRSPPAINNACLASFALTWLPHDYCACFPGVYF